MSHTRRIPDKVLKQDTKHEMVAFVHGYILGLEDVLEDSDKMLPGGQIPDTLKRIIIGSLSEARETLEIIGGL